MKPTTETGRRAVEAIKGGALGLWADDPDDLISRLVADVEAAARADLLKELPDALAWFADVENRYYYLVTKPGWHGGHYANSTEFADVIARRIEENRK